MVQVNLVQMEDMAITVLTIAAPSPSPPVAQNHDLEVGCCENEEWENSEKNGDATGEEINALMSAIQNDVREMMCNWEPTTRTLDGMELVRHLKNALKKDAKETVDHWGAPMEKFMQLVSSCRKLNELTKPLGGKRYEDFMAGFYEDIDKALLTLDSNARDQAGNDSNAAITNEGEQANGNGGTHHAAIFNLGEISEYIGEEVVLVENDSDLEPELNNKMEDENLIESAENGQTLVSFRRDVSSDTQVVNRTISKRAKQVSAASKKTATTVATTAELFSEVSNSCPQYMSQKSSKYRKVADKYNHVKRVRCLKNSKHDAEICKNKTEAKDPFVIENDPTTTSLVKIKPPVTRRTTKQSTKRAVATKISGFSLVQPVSSASSGLSEGLSSPLEKGREDDTDNKDDRDSTNAKVPACGDDGIAGEGLPSFVDSASSTKNKVKKKKHPIVIPEHITIFEGRPTMYQCKVCQGTPFKTKSNVKYHKNCGTGEQPFKCERCGESFEKEEAYKYHNIKKHLKVKHHACPKCGKKFPVKHKLNRHLKSHSGDKPFVCEICRKGYKSADALKSHSLIHTGERKHKCLVCQKSFYDLSSLKKHGKIHQTGGEKFTCIPCDQAFQNRLALNKHQREIHPIERPFACNQCTLRFRYEKDLRRHINSVHSDERPFKCSFCKVACKRKDNFVRHLNNLHKMIPQEEAKNIAVELAIKNGSGKIINVEKSTQRNPVALIARANSSKKQSSAACAQDPTNSRSSTTSIDTEPEAHMSKANNTASNAIPFSKRKNSSPVSLHSTSSTTNKKVKASTQPVRSRSTNICDEIQPVNIKSCSHVPSIPNGAKYAIVGTRPEEDNENMEERLRKEPTLVLSGDGTDANDEDGTEPVSTVETTSDAEEEQRFPEVVSLSETPTLGLVTNSLTKASSNPTANSRNLETTTSNRAQNGEGNNRPRRRSPCGRFGLHNPSTHCYINSTLQLLMSAPEVRQAFSNSESKLHKYYQAIFVKESNKVEMGLLKQGLELMLDDFKGNKQHDASEFLMKLTNNRYIEKELNGCFKISFEKTLLCENGHRSVSTEDEQCMFVQPEKTISTALREELAEGRVDRKCCKCGSKTALCRKTITHTPNALLVLVKIVYDNSKKTKRFSSPEEKISFGSESQNYELQAVVSHVGRETHKGHYIAFVKEGETIFCFNDNLVSRVNKVNEVPYLLLYTKIDPLVNFLVV